MIAAVLVEPGALRAGDVVSLDAAERRHLAVRRIVPGVRVEVFDGAGAYGVGTIVSDTTATGVAVESVTVAPRPGGTVLAVGAGDRDRFVALAERCTEFAVERLVPLVTERVRSVANRVRDSDLDRARRRAREACKQSRNAWGTSVGGFVTLDGLGALGADTWWMAEPGGNRCPTVGAGATVGWIIGPEGGLTDDELAVCRDVVGATPVRLATSVLRFDSAAIAAAAVTFDRRIPREQT